MNLLNNSPENKNLENKIDNRKFSHLANLSKLNFSEKEEAALIDDLNLIAGFIDKVCEYDEQGLKPYDDTIDSGCVSYSQLREDASAVTATPQQLLANTQSENNCYTIPRVID